MLIFPTPRHLLPAAAPETETSGAEQGTSERRCAHPPCGKRIDPRVTSPCPEHIESSVESSQPLTSSHRVHLSAEITASKLIPPTRQAAEEEGGRRSAAAG